MNLLKFTLLELIVAHLQMYKEMLAQHQDMLARMDTTIVYYKNEVKDAKQMLKKLKQYNAPGSADIESAIEAAKEAVRRATAAKQNCDNTFAAVREETQRAVLELVICFNSL